MGNEQDENAIVIAGAGLTGLMSALRLRQLNPDKKIVLFDRSSEIGGMYGSIAYPDNIIFDYGMHVIYESCNSEVDDLYRKVMSENEWHIYEKNEKDIAGLFFRGRLQGYSHYVDLRSFPEEAKTNLAGSLFLNLDNPKISDPQNAADFLKNQFGQEVVDTVHLPILKRMYGKEPNELDVFATRATALERVVLFDCAPMLDLMKSSMIRARLAYPDQLNLPPLRENTQKALYPKKFGMVHFIAKLKALLESSGVEILTDTSVSEISRDGEKIRKISLSNNKWGSRTINADKVLWTVGWPALARELKVNISDLEFQKGPEMVFLNLKFNRPPVMGRLYYFYCYDEGFASFRVTNYTNYCPAAATDGQYPVCVEFWPSKIGRNRSDLSQEECVRIALQELEKFGVIGSEHELVFSKMESNVGEFPMPSLVNSRSLKEIRSRVSEYKIKNLAVAGIMAEDGLFFIPDILNDAFSKLKSF